MSKQEEMRGYSLIEPGENILSRLSLRGQFSGHVYVVCGSALLLLKSIKHNNVMAPGGIIGAEETLGQGLKRELKEEFGPVKPYVMKQLTKGNAVGIWRKTERFGFHNSFVLPRITEAQTESYMLDYRTRLEAEKAGPNRKEYLEGDGGIVLVELSEIERAVGDSSDSAEPVVKCRRLADQGQELIEDHVPLRRAIMPALALLPELLAHVEKLPLTH